MADMISLIYKNRKANVDKLKAYGFKQTDAGLTYSRHLMDDTLLLNVTVSAQGEVSASVTDMQLNEPYTLHLAKGAAGSFVGGVRAEYENVLTDIAEKCFEPDVFKSEYAKRLIEYVEKTYGDLPEFLWKKFPNNAIWRCKENQKWYGALLTVSKGKLGIEADGEAEIIDLRIEPEALEMLVDNKMYYPGYHMNKKHWYTIILDGSVPLEEICSRIKDSYELARKK